MISSICIYSGSLARLNESVAAWNSQSYGDRELIIFNCAIRQRLKCDLPNVRIIQAKRPMMVQQARNAAIEAAAGDIITLWPSDDICFPNHLGTIAESINGFSWCWTDKEFVLDRGSISRLAQSGTFGFSFTKQAWIKAGKYGHGVRGASERNFIGKLTSKFPGQKITLNPKSVTFIRIGTEADKRLRLGTVMAGDVELAPGLERDYEDLVRCFFNSSGGKKIGVVILGRNGDIVNCLPFLKLIHDNYCTPYVAIAKEFKPLFDGVGYAVPIVVAEKEESLGDAMSKAQREFDIVIRAQIWGRGHVQNRECDAYNLESWREMGLMHRFNDETLRPVFDRRSPDREANLIASIPDSGKPWILVNLVNAKSAPCPNCPSLMPTILKRWGEQYQIVDISKIQAERLYDFIGLFERSAALVSIDTCFIHMAAATNIPVVALVSKAWGGTIVRMNCVGRIQYESAIANPNLVHDAIAKAVGIKHEPVEHEPVEIESTAQAHGCKVFHAVDRFDESDPKDMSRKMICWASWDSLYESGQLIPAHCWKYSRNARDTMGDRRALPYLKDLLDHSMAQAGDDDIILWTNDDNLIHPKIVEYLRFHVGVYGPCSIPRCEFRGVVPSMESPPDQVAKKSSGKQIGRDGFAFKKKWLRENWDWIPDAVLGAPMWDIHLAGLIRCHYKIKTTNSNMSKIISPAEIPAGYLGHIAHHSSWNTKDVNRVPSKIHNSELFRRFATRMMPQFKITPEGNVM
jgi:hypothetical protein